MNLGMLLKWWPSLVSLPLILKFLLFHVYSFNPSLQLSCHEAERSALLQFKHSFVIDKSTCRYEGDYPKTSSWDSEGGSSNCCLWDGVECDKETGHVIGLDLSGGCIYGSIHSNSSLFHLVHLRKLNLADNNFNLSSIPTSIGQLSEMTDLDLSSSFFSGQVPSSFSKLTQLTYINLESNLLSGFIPSSLQNLTQLMILRMYDNHISGPIPSWMGNLSELNILRLSMNELHGPIPQSLSKLNNLESLKVYENNLDGTVEFDMFFKMRHLSSLNLGENKLSVVFGAMNMSATTLPKFKTLALSSCNISDFPNFLQHQNELQILHLANNRLFGQIPQWICNSSVETLSWLEISNNFLTGFRCPPTILPWVQLRVLFLDSNMLQGQLLIPPSSTEDFDVSNNMLSGEISPLICNLSSIRTLDLSDNKFSGSIPHCLGNSSSSLKVLNLRNNSFHGTISPLSFEKGGSLKMIDLSHNQFKGKLPRSLATCMMLEYLDFSRNQLVDIFPTWLVTLPGLKVLVLKKNGFHGVIPRPENTSVFPNLHIIDISYNSFTGPLPSEFLFIWSGMNAFGRSNSTYMNAGAENIDGSNVLFYNYGTSIVVKSVDTNYEKIRQEFAAIDLSSNKFSGEIPGFIGNLTPLHALNLSNNMLTGRIPLSIGSLSQLESLDLSWNVLSGEIPQQLTQLNFLQSFDVSHNNLTGPIPEGSQLRTFNSSAFEGNPGLCGYPLPKKCGDSKALPPAADEEDDDSGSPIELDWKFVLAGAISGFVVGAALGDIMITKRKGWFLRAFGRIPRRMEIRQVRN